MRKYGTRQDVWDNVCQMTRGGLTKDDLIFKNGKLVSKRKSEAAKAAYEKFGFNKREEQKVEEPVKKKRKRRKSKRHETKSSE